MIPTTTFYLTHILTFVWHSHWHLFWQSMWHLALAIKVSQCPMRSASCSWGPAVPTDIWRSQCPPHSGPRLRSSSAGSQLRSGSAHSDLELALEEVEVEVDVEGGRMHLWQNLQDLTWQVGNKQFIQTHITQKVGIPNNNDWVCFNYFMSPSYMQWWKSQRQVGGWPWAGT